MKGEGRRNKSLHGGAAKQRRLREKAETLVEEQGERQPCCVCVCVLVQYLQTCSCSSAWSLGERGERREGEGREEGGRERGRGKRHSRQRIAAAQSEPGAYTPRRRCLPRPRLPRRPHAPLVPLSRLHLPRERLIRQQPLGRPQPHTIAPQRGKGEGTAPLRMDAARGRAGGGRQSPGARKGGGVAKQPGSLRGKGEQRRHLQSGAPAAAMPPAASGRGGRGIHDVRAPREARRGRAGSAGPPTATPSGSARYWAGPGQGRRDGLRSPRPLPRPDRSPAGGAGARGCQGCRSAPPGRAAQLLCGGGSSGGGHGRSARLDSPPPPPLLPPARLCHIWIPLSLRELLRQDRGLLTFLPNSEPPASRRSKHRAGARPPPPRCPPLPARRRTEAPRCGGRAASPTRPAMGLATRPGAMPGARSVPEAPQGTLRPSVCTQNHPTISECPVLGGTHKDHRVQFPALHGTSPGITPCA